MNRAVAKVQKELDEWRKRIEQQRREEAEKIKEVEICRQREHEQRKRKIDQEMEQLKNQVEQLERQHIAQVQQPNQGARRDPNGEQFVKSVQEGSQPRSVNNRQQDIRRPRADSVHSHGPEHSLASLARDCHLDKIEWDVKDL